MPPPRPGYHGRAPAPQDAYHPFDKLVIGLPTAMPEWRDAYGAAREWRFLPPNPTIAGAGPDAVRENANYDASDAAGGQREQGASGGGVPSQPALPQPQQRRGHHDDGFYCDACQRGFATREKYAVHMDTHIYCTVPGCHFTCRNNKPWRMEEHVELLHHRPDAPNLVDTSAYLEQRRRRFPTQDAVKGKVEELYYKAARGVVLPDERRRWMRQHGIVIHKRPRTDASFIARGELPGDSRSPSAASSATAPSSRSSSCSSGSQHRPGPPHGAVRSVAPAPSAEAVRSRFLQPPTAAEVPVAEFTDPTAPPLPQPPAEASPPAAAPTSGAQLAPPAARPTKLIPLGPNGTLTPRQRVQLVRERYAAAKEVPQFYVCHRCGSKGEHWVADCPTKGDSTYDRRVVWGEAKLVAADKGTAKAPRLSPPRGISGKTEKAEEQTPTGPHATSPQPITEAAPDNQVVVELGSCDAMSEPVELDARATSLDEAPPALNGHVELGDGVDDDKPPPAQSAAAPADAPREVTRMMAPVAAARRVQQHRRDPMRRPPPPPTLYERLTEEARMDEQGVLLQALRFFAARDFFQDRPQP